MNSVLFVLVVITIIMFIYFIGKELKMGQMNKSQSNSTILLGVLQLLIGFLNVGERVSCFSFAAGILIIITSVIRTKKTNNCFNLTYLLVTDFCTSLRSAKTAPNKTQVKQMFGGRFAPRKL